MRGQHPTTRRVRRLVVATGMAFTLVVTAGCGGGGETDGTPSNTVAPAGESTDDTVVVKNRPLNNCVSVMSGERPAAGTRIPPCPQAGTRATTKP